MEIMELCQQLISALDHLRRNNADNLILTAYLILVLFKRDAAPVIFLMVGSSLVYFYTLQLPESQFYILCSIACSYTAMYYFNQKNRACVGLAVMSMYMFLMGQETLINVISQDFYLSLYNSYEVCVSAIHLLIIALFIRWKRLLDVLVKFINDTRSGWNCFNHLCNVL